jgi:HEAT repeat protein
MPATSRLLNKMTDSGLLVSCQENRMRFLHPVFGGYLAGRALAAVNADHALLQQPDWAGKHIAMRYVAAHGDATGLATAMLRQAQMPLQSSLFTVARWLRDAPREAPWRGRIFAQLASLLQTEGIPLTLRAQTVAAFYWSEDPGAAPLFRQFLRTTSFELIQLAALGSGAVCDHKAIDRLSSILFAPSPSAQRAGCLALVALGTPPAMETVARALLNGEEDLRRAAAEALSNDPNEGYSMLKEGLTLADILLRRAVVYGLARVEEQWAVEALQHIRVEDDQWVVRNSAGEVLDSKNQMDPRVPRPLTEERLAALPYLRRTPSEGVITSMYHAMYRDDPEMREAVFLVLCDLAASGIKLPAPEQFGLG